MALLLLAHGAMAAIADTPGVPQVRVEVSRRGDAWNADFIFDRPRCRLGVSALRPDRATRPALAAGIPGPCAHRGVRLQRRGSYDVLVADRGKLPTARDGAIQAGAEGLQADYAPALVFTDGSVALFVAQFDCFPMDSMAAVRALPSDLNNQLVPAAEQKYVFRDAAGPVLLEGRRSAAAETAEREHLRALRRHAARSRRRTWSASSIRSCPRGSRIR